MRVNVYTLMILVLLFFAVGFFNGFFWYRPYKIPDPEMSLFIEEYHKQQKELIIFKDSLQKYGEKR